MKHTVSSNRSGVVSQGNKNVLMISVVDPMVASASEKGGDCCPLVADPKTLLVLLVKISLYGTVKVP